MVRGRDQGSSLQRALFKVNAALFSTEVGLHLVLDPSVLLQSTLHSVYVVSCRARRVNFSLVELAALLLVSRNGHALPLPDRIVNRLASARVEAARLELRSLWLIGAWTRQILFLLDQVLTAGHVELFLDARIDLMRFLDHWTHFSFLHDNVF